MHLLGCAENGVYRAGLNTLGAANTLRFADVGDFFDIFNTVAVIQCDRFNVQ